MFKVLSTIKKILFSWNIESKTINKEKINKKMSDTLSSGIVYKTVIYTYFDGTLMSISEPIYTCPGDSINIKGNGIITKMEDD